MGSILYFRHVFNEENELHFMVVHRSYVRPYPPATNFTKYGRIQVAREPLTVLCFYLHQGPYKECRKNIGQYKSEFAKLTELAEKIGLPDPDKEPIFTAPIKYTPIKPTGRPRKTRRYLSPFTSKKSIFSRPSSPFSPSSEQRFLPSPTSPTSFHASSPGPSRNITPPFNISLPSISPDQRYIISPPIISPGAPFQHYSTSTDSSANQLLDQEEMFRPSTSTEKVFSPNNKITSLIDEAKPYLSTLYSSKDLESFCSRGFLAATLEFHLIYFGFLELKKTIEHFFHYPVIKHIYWSFENFGRSKLKLRSNSKVLYLTFNCDNKPGYWNAALSHGISLARDKGADILICSCQEINPTNFQQEFSVNSILPEIRRVRRGANENWIHKAGNYCALSLKGPIEVEKFRTNSKAFIARILVLPNGQRLGVVGCYFPPCISSDATTLLVHLGVILGLMKKGEHDCVGKTIENCEQVVALGDLNFNNPTAECYNSPTSRNRLQEAFLKIMFDHDLKSAIDPELPTTIRGTSIDYIILSKSLKVVETSKLHDSPAHLNSGYHLIMYAVTEIPY